MAWSKLSDEVDQWPLNEFVFLALLTHPDEEGDWTWGVWSEILNDDDDQTPSGEYEVYVDGWIKADTRADAQDMARQECRRWLMSLVNAL